MFGFRFIKTLPTTYLIQYRDGAAIREGAGLSFFYFAPNSSLVAVPIASKEQGFIFEQVTGDFQSVTVQGEVAYRVAEPGKLAAMLDYSLKADGRGYQSDDPEKLPQRVISVAEVLSKDIVKKLRLRNAVQAADLIAEGVSAGLRTHPVISALGLQVLGVAIHAVKPTPETTRALEAETREAILKAADDAVYSRRNAAVENERSIRKSELDTEIAVEEKRRDIQQKKHEARHAAMEADVALEERRKDFVTRNAENTRTLAEADAHRLVAVMKAMDKADPRIVQALAAAGMQPSQLIAQAFGGIADKAERIGQLNVSPDLLQALLTATAAVPASKK
jgi:hypothetical protein